MGGEIIAERFSLLKTRGSNGLAFTHIVEDILDGRRLVIKVSDRLGILGLEYLKSVNLLAESAVQGILLPIEGGLLEEEEGYYLAFPELGEPSLDNYLRMRPSLSCEEVLDILKGIVSALEGLHRTGFLHLFLEPRNVFYLPRRSVTLKDPALRAEFFHPFLELVSAPDFSCLQPEIMDGGLPGPDADLFALGKLAEKLLVSANDAHASPLGDTVASLARDYGDASRKGIENRRGDVLDALISIRQDLERAARKVHPEGKRPGGRFFSSLWNRSGGTSVGNPEVGRKPGVGSSRSSQEVSPTAAVVGERDSAPRVTVHEHSLEGPNGLGVEEGSPDGARRPDVLPERDFPLVESAHVESGEGSFLSEERSGTSNGAERTRRASFSRRARLAGALRLAALSLGVGLVFLLPIYLVSARGGEGVGSAAGWGASEAGGETVLSALREARKGPAKLGGCGELEVREESGRAGSVEGASGIRERDGAQAARDEEKPRFEGEGRVAGQSSISPQRPVARFTVTPSEGQSPLCVYLDASSSYDPDGRIVSYRWSCGGGASAFFQVFESNIIPARIAVTLTVTDEGGNTDSVTQYVILY